MIVDDDDKEYEVTLKFTAETSFLVAASCPEEASGIAEAMLHDAVENDDFVAMSKPYVHPEMIVTEYHDPNVHEEVYNHDDCKG